MAIAISWHSAPITTLSGSRSRDRIGILALCASVVVVLGIVAWTIAASVFSLSVLAFTTSSMAPTIPLGSVAIVEKVAASSVSIGDVVTVTRGDSPPVTQRVIAMQLSGSTAQLTLRGDAYDGGGVTYGVSEVRRVVATMPAVGDILRTVLRPIVLAPAIAFLVIAMMWVVWPDKSTTPKSTPNANVHSRHREAPAAHNS